MSKSIGIGVWATLAVALSACGGPGGEAELSAALASNPPAGVTIGGAIDNVTIDPATGQVTVTGWHMLTPTTKSHVLDVYAPGATSIVSISRRDRPDVVEAINNKDLARAGFMLVIGADTDTGLSELCITFDDKHYGARLLNAKMNAPLRCTSMGQ